MEKLLDFGDHLVSIYQDSKQQFSELVPYITSALTSNQKCIYVVDDNTKDVVYRELEKGGLILDKYLESKQFIFLTKKETYLIDGIFNASKTIDLLKNLEKTAREEGYEGVLGIGEMTWILGNNLEAETLLEYESAINDLKKYNLALICQYNEKKFDQEFLVNIIRTHPQAIIYGDFHENKYFYTPPEYFSNSTGFPLGTYKTVVDMITEK